MVLGATVALLQGCAGNLLPQGTLPDIAEMPSRTVAASDRVRLEKVLLETQSIGARRQTDALDEISRSR